MCNRLDGVSFGIFLKVEKECKIRIIDDYRRVLVIYFCFYKSRKKLIIKRWKEADKPIIEEKFTKTIDSLKGTIKCCICGKDFDSNGSVTCSNECRAVFKFASTSSRKCLYCGNRFTIINGKGRQKLCCSDNCITALSNRIQIEL